MRKKHTTWNNFKRRKVWKAKVGKKRKHRHHWEWDENAPRICKHCDSLYGNGAYVCKKCDEVKR